MDCSVNAALRRMRVETLNRCDEEDENRRPNCVQIQLAVNSPNNKDMLWLSDRTTVAK